MDKSDQLRKQIELSICPVDLEVNLTPLALVHHLPIFVKDKIQNKSNRDKTNCCPRVRVKGKEANRGSMRELVEGWTYSASGFGSCYFAKCLAAFIELCANKTTF